MEVRLVGFQAGAFWPGVRRGSRAFLIASGAFPLLVSGSTSRLTRCASPCNLSSEAAPVVRQACWGQTHKSRKESRLVVSKRVVASAGSDRKKFFSLAWFPKRPVSYLFRLGSAHLAIRLLPAGSGDIEREAVQVSEEDRDSSGQSFLPADPGPGAQGQPLRR